MPNAMSAVVHDFTELERTLRVLPPPSASCVRVFRGQTSDFPTMLPSACRPSAPTIGPLWDFALLSVRMNAIAIDKPSANIEMINEIALWFKVLAQHYGPGSPYLDVTLSINVALWFALNRASTVEPLNELFVSQSGIESVSIKYPTLKFSKHMDEAGWFYVLDVPRADGDSIPGHGQLLELSAGPAFVSTCLRVVRQNGGLVRGDCAIEGGNLTSYFACRPIAVARPFYGCPFIDQDPHFLFPPPTEDKWYARLLRAPLVPQPAITNGFEYRQSLDVNIVTPEAKKEEALPILERQIARMSPMIRAGLRTNSAMRKRLRDAVGVDPETATYLQLEIPLLYTLPPAESWNQSVLVAGISKRTQPKVESSDELLPAVSLENVLIELSPLETALVDLPSHTTPLTALWLVKHGPVFRFTVFATSYDTTSYSSKEMFVVDTLDIEFSDATHCFEVVQNGCREPLLQAGLPAAHVKAFLVSLNVLRSLSATLKPDPYPVITIDCNRILLPVRGVSTVLTRTKSDPADLRLHFLRCSDSRQPYRGPGPELPSVAVLKLETTDRFETLPSLREVYGHVREVQLGQQRVTLPKREFDDMSAVIADFLSSLFSQPGQL